MSGGETAVALARTRVRSVGTQLSPEILTDLKAVYAPLQLPPAAGVRIERDLAYGPHDRHRLNLFLPHEATSADVLLFVHGGGFITGDKDESPGAFYDNIGLWAAAHGLVGATMNYRLAPDHCWPAGLEDVASALAWLKQNISVHCGNPARIFVMGHSAGASHVAGYLARAGADALVAGAICLSGLYDTSPPVNPIYYGSNPEELYLRSPLPGVVGSHVPLLVLHAEFDPAPISGHFVRLLVGFQQDLGRLPGIGQLRGHNHFSAILHLNTPDTALSDEILRFLNDV